MFNPIFLAIFGGGFLAGLVAGYVCATWLLRVNPCPRCGGTQAFDEMRYRCGDCGEVTTVEEL